MLTSVALTPSPVHATLTGSVELSSKMRPPTASIRPPVYLKTGSGKRARTRMMGVDVITLRVDMLGEGLR